MPKINIDCNEIIHSRGKFRQYLTLEERSLFIDYMCMAFMSPVRGNICASETVGYTNGQLASMLNAPEEIIIGLNKKLSEIKEAKVFPSNIIKMVNWKKYKGEYDRQKKYRENKKSRYDISSKEWIKVVFQPTYKEYVKEPYIVTNWGRDCGTIKTILLKLEEQYPDKDPSVKLEEMLVNFMKTWEGGSDFWLKDKKPVISIFVSSINKYHSPGREEISPAYLEKRN